MPSTGPDYKMVENLRRKLMTNNNDYDLHEAREASDRALVAALDIGSRTPNTLGITGERTPVAQHNVQYRAQKSTSDRLRSHASEATTDNVRQSTPEATSDNITTREPKSTSSTVTANTHNVPLGGTNSTQPDKEVAIVKNALDKVLFTFAFFINLLAVSRDFFRDIFFQPFFVLLKR